MPTLWNLLSETDTVIYNGVEAPACIEAGIERGGEVIERLSVATFNSGKYIGQIHAYSVEEAKEMGIISRTEFAENWR